MQVWTRISEAFDSFFSSGFLSRTIDNDEEERATFRHGVYSFNKAEEMKQHTGNTHYFFRSPSI